MDACDSDAPLEVMAQARGWVFLKVPQPAASAGELLTSLADSIREFGEFASQAAEKIADGDVSAEDMASIDKETNDVVEAVLAFRKLARTTHENRHGRARHE